MTKCPLCNYNFNDHSSFLYHILDKHDNPKTRFYFKLLKTSNGICHSCGAKLDPKTAMSHLASCNTDKSLNIIANKPLYKPKSHKEKLSPFIKHLLSSSGSPQHQQHQQHHKNQQKAAEVAPPKVVEKPEEEEDDLEYVRFIASSIATSGLDVDPIDIAPITPVNTSEDSKRNANTISVDQDFWEDLDKIFLKMNMDDCVTMDEDTEEITCKKCNKSFHSTTRFLQHCYDYHKDLLRDF